MQVKSCWLEIINVNSISLIFLKLNELKWNAILKEKKVHFHLKEINWKYFSK